MLQGVMDRKTGLVLLAVLMLGLFLRTYCLTCESLWLDEGYSVLWAKQAPPEMIDAVSRDVHPPLYFLILHYWIGLFGDSEAAIRLLSVIFGSLAIIMIYMVGSRLFGRDTGILCSLMLSLSVLHVHYSQEIRGYSLMVLLTLVSMYFFLKLLENRSNPVRAGYIISSALLMYTHFFGLFVIAAQNVYVAYLFLSSGKARAWLREWIVLQSALFVIYLPWLGFLVRQAMVVQGGEFLGWLPGPSLYQLAATFFEYSGYFNASAPLWVTLLSAALSVILIALSISSALRMRESERGKAVFLSAWLFTLILLPFIISQFSAPIYLARFTMPASLAFYILAARGITGIRRKALRLASICLIAALSFAAVWGYYTVTDNEQWREAVAHIEANAEHGDLALINTWYCHIPFDYYFTRQDLVTVDLFPKWDYAADEENIKALPDAVQGYGRVWLVLSHDGDPHGLIRSMLTEELSYGIAEDRQYYGIELYLFEKEI